MGKLVKLCKEESSLTQPGVLPGRCVQQVGGGHHQGGRGACQGDELADDGHCMAAECWDSLSIKLDMFDLSQPELICFEENGTAINLGPCLLLVLS